MSEHNTTDLMGRLRAELPRLTPKLQAIARLALDETEHFIRHSSRELCAELNTSEPTLIRFCRMFGYTGLSDFRIELALSLSHQPGLNSFVEPLPHDRRQVNLAAKKRIAQCAADIVRADRALLIDNGSTAELFASALGDHDPLSIMTTGLVVAQNALSHGNHEVMMTGGTIRPEAMAMTGRLVETSLQHMRFDTFVMGADSIEANEGLSTYREDEAHSNRAMIACAARVVVLADKTKFSKPALHRICNFDQIDCLITDLPEDTPALDLIREKGVDIFCAGPEQDSRRGYSVHHAQMQTAS